MPSLMDTENRRLVKYHLKVDVFEDEDTPKYKVTLWVATARLRGDGGWSWSGNNLSELIATAKHWAPKKVAEYRAKYGSPKVHPQTSTMAKKSSGPKVDHYDDEEETEADDNEEDEVETVDPQGAMPKPDLEMSLPKTGRSYSGRSDRWFVSPEMREQFEAAMLTRRVILQLRESNGRISYLLPYDPAILVPTPAEQSHDGRPFWTIYVKRLANPSWGLVEVPSNAGR